VVVGLVSWPAFSVATETIIAGGRSPEQACRISAVFSLFSDLGPLRFLWSRVVSLSSRLVFSSIAAGTLLPHRTLAILPATEISAEIFLGLFFVGCFVFGYLWCSFSMVVDFGFSSLMFESICVDGKTFEAARGGGSFLSELWNLVEEEGSLSC